jgi:hypothetical protein
MAVGWSAELLLDGDAAFGAAALGGESFGLGVGL